MKIYMKILLILLICLSAVFLFACSKKYEVYNVDSFGTKQMIAPMYVETNNKGLFLHIEKDCKIIWFNNGETTEQSKDKNPKNSFLSCVVYDEYGKSEVEKLGINGFLVKDFSQYGSYERNVVPKFKDSYWYKAGAIIDLEDINHILDNKRYSIKEFMIQLDDE